MKRKRERRERAHLRVRSRVRGTGERPRLSVYKSLKYVYAQVIDDSRGVTLAQASSADPDVRGGLAEANAADTADIAKTAGTGETAEKKSPKGTGSQAAAKLVGEKIAERAKAQGIERVVFDRGGYIYHGKVKAVAEGAREKGLQF
ncbi:MAG TPA: 50S ribosomal protein L18 [Thermoanaerobaculia bacterium]|nr:50S ribosomal protein L18 [Thermoanaerobaculia bacterium]